MFRPAFSLVMNDTISNGITSMRLDLLRRLAALGLVVAVIGLPLNHLTGYGIVLFLTVVVFVGEVTASRRSWLAAVALALLALVAQFALKPPRIEEGHNVFLVDAAAGPSTSDALLTGLPPDVYRLMAAEFNKVYPPERRCDPNAFGCWRAGINPNRTFAFSADGIFDKGEFSRRVDDIDFVDPVWLRLGFTNELGYGWTTSSDVRRLRRDGRFWMGLHRWHLTMPYFVMYRFPAAFARSELCWQGDVVWEERAERFTLLSNAAWACRMIEPGDIGHRIFGLGIRPGTLAMALDPPPFVRVWQWAMLLLKLLVIGALVALLIRWRRRTIILPFALTALSLFIIAVEDASFIGAFRPLDGGDDGLFYEGMGRRIVQSLLSADYARTLEGGESVFFFGGPGLRYLRALERLIFGDTNLGYLSLVLLLPLVVLAIGRRFLSPRWALVFGFVFVAVPVGAFFGTTFFLYSKWAARGFADSASAIFALCGLLILVGRHPPGPDRSFGSAFGAGILFALAVFVRPNVAPFVGIMLGGAGLYALQAGQWSRIAGLCLGFLPVSSMAMHNWYFGDVLVPFSANSTHPLVFVMPPSAWVAALAELVRFDPAGEHALRAGSQIAQWLSGPSDSPALIPLHATAVVILVHVALDGRLFDPWLRLISGAALMQHAVSLCYVATARYHLLAWFVTSLVVVVWFERQGLGVLQRRWPLFFDRLRQHPFSQALSRSLSDVDRTSTGERR